MPGVEDSVNNPYMHNMHNLHKSSVQGNSADIADSAYRGEVVKCRDDLTYIGETDPVSRDEILEKCRVDSNARQYFLKQSEKV